METTNKKSKEDDMIVLLPLTDADPPSHVEMDEHLAHAKEQVSRISSIKPVRKITHSKRVCDDHTARGMGWIQAGC